MMCLKGVGREPTVEEAVRFIQVRTRLDRAVELKPKKIGQGLYEVPSQRGRGVYTVDLLSKTCTCMDFTVRGGLCKHLLAAKLADDSQEQVPVIAVTKKHEGENLIYADDPPNFHYEEIY
jgi:hypothetical protein